MTAHAAMAIVPLVGNWPSEENGDKMRLRGAIVAIVSILALALTATPGQASTVTIGSPLSAKIFGALVFSSKQTIVQTALTEPGALVASPVNGAIVRWRIAGASAGPWSLRVVRPAGGGTYTGAGTSEAKPGGPGTLTYTTSLPVKAGDLIGIENSASGDSIPYAPIPTVPSANMVYWSPPLADGGPPSAPAPGYPEWELPYNADIQPVPAISGINVASGSISGGTSVVVTGLDFTGATAVKFGDASAAGYAVNSDTQITAASPRISAPGAVDISITTPAGVTPAVAADRFTYIACVVPRLKGKKLKTDRKKLRKAHCKLDKVRGKKGKGTKVKTQKPKPGTVLAPGSKVNVKVG